jgi:hypothetical protein
MTEAQLSPRALAQRAFNLFPFLAGRKGIVVGFEAATKLGLNQDAFHEMLLEGFGPEPRPAFDYEYFWLQTYMMDAFRSWVCKEASEEDLAHMVEIVRKHDRFNDYKYLWNEPPRTFLLHVMGIDSDTGKRWPWRR